MEQHIQKQISTMMNIAITSATVTREVGMGENPCRFSELLEKFAFCSKQVEGLLSEKKFSRQEKKTATHSGLTELIPNMCLSIMPEVCSKR